MGTGPREWDASTYDRVAAPMTRMGSAVLDRLPLRGDEVVLDAGCGLGGLTRYLASERGCAAVGVDLTVGYVQTAAALTRLVGLEGNVSFCCSSALALPFENNFVVELS